MQQMSSAVADHVRWSCFQCVMLTQALLWFRSEILGVWCMAVA
jgi:hypothetical protein